MSSSIKVFIGGDECVPCDLDQVTLCRDIQEPLLKSFNFFRPDTDLSVYRELCSLVFELGAGHDIVAPFMEKHGYKYDATQLIHLEQILAHNLMQEQAEWEFVDDRDF